MDHTDDALRERATDEKRVGWRLHQLSHTQKVHIQGLAQPLNASIELDL
jgi:hypothetical protein